MLQQLKQQIDEVFKAISTQSGNPVALLESANKLLTINYNLGKLYTDTFQEAQLAEVEYKRALDRAFLTYRQAKQPIEEAKAHARLDVDQVPLIKLEVTVKELGNLRKDLSDKVSVIQSYCSHFKSQMISEHRQNSA